jgi:hypothetical protein
MDAREIYKEKIEKKLSKWKPAIDELKARLEHAEENTKSKLSEQLAGLPEKRAKAEKILGEIASASHEAWEGVKSGIDQGWRDLSRTAKRTMSKVRDAVGHGRRDEEIRQIAYYIWLDAGRPEGKHVEHWLQAEAIWREQHAAKQPESPRPAKVKRKSTATAPQGEGRAPKTRTARRKGSINRSVEKTQQRQ